MMLLATFDLQKGVTMELTPYQQNALNVFPESKDLPFPFNLFYCSLRYSMKRTINVALSHKNCCMLLPEMSVSEFNRDWYFILSSSLLATYQIKERTFIDEDGQPFQCPVVKMNHSLYPNEESINIFKRELTSIVG